MIEINIFKPLSPLVHPVILRSFIAVTEVERSSNNGHGCEKSVNQFSWHLPAKPGLLVSRMHSYIKRVEITVLAMLSMKIRR